MKTFYENPELEIVRFEIEDVITTSSFEDGGANNEGGWGDVN